jgi:cobalt-zinc-cadmium resistance protein CzcA
LAVPLALGLIFVLLYMAFGQIKPALLIYLNVPFAAVGGIFLLARGACRSPSARRIGFIALFGISVLNGVVLLTTIKKLRAGQVRSRLHAKGAESRLRAVVMTATVAALGFIPMALSSSAGAEVQRPLATVVIGGPRERDLPDAVRAAHGLRVRLPQGGACWEPGFRSRRLRSLCASASWRSTP